MKPFYILWNPDCSLPPRMRFETQKEAEDCAKSCVPKFKANELYVMKAAAVAKPSAPPVKLERIK